MERDEIIRIQRNVFAYLSPERGSRVVPGFLDVLTETIPKNSLIQLEQRVVSEKRMLEIAKKNRIKKRSIQQELEKSDYNSELHKELLDMVLITNAVDLKMVLEKVADKKIDEIMKDLEGTDIWNLEKLGLYSVALRDSGIPFEDIGKELPARIGAIYEVLNQANSEYVRDVAQMPLGKLLHLMHDGKIPSRQLYGYVWGCVVSERPARKIPIMYAGKSTIAFAMPSGVIKETNFTHELFEEVKSGWKREAGLSEDLESLQREIERLRAENERAAAESQRKAEAGRKRYETLENMYTEAKKRIEELETGGEFVERLRGAENELEEAREELEKARAESAEHLALAEEFSEEPFRLEGQLSAANQRIRELEARLPDENVTADDRLYYIDDADLRTNIERKGIHYEMACAILGAGFKMFRFKKLSGVNLRKNTYGALDNGLKKEFEQLYDPTFKALVKVGAVERISKDGYQVQNTTRAIDDVHVGRLVQALLDRKQEIQG